MSEKRILELEERMMKLEKEVELLKGVKQKELQSVNNIQEENAIREIKPKPKETYKPIPKQNVDWEKQIGRIWLPRIFMVVLLIGVVWAFKAAIDNNIITEPVRIFIGYLTAIVLFVLGEKQFNRKRRTLGLVLLGGSISLLMLTTFAGHVLYGLIPVAGSVLLNLLWVGIGIYLSYRHRSQELTIFMGFAGYLMPFLLDGQANNMYLFVLYEFVLFMSLLVISMKERYLKLFYISTLFLHVTYLAYQNLSSLLLPIEKSLTLVQVIAVAIFIQHAVLLVAAYKWNLFKKKELPLLFTSFLLTLLWLYNSFDVYIYEDDYNTWLRHFNEFGSIYDYVLLGMAILYGILSYLCYTANKKVKLSVFSSIGLFSLTLFFIAVLEFEQLKIVFLLESLVVYYMGIHIPSKLQRASSIFLLFISSILIFIESAYMENVWSMETLEMLLLLGVLVGFLQLTSQYRDKLKNHQLLVNGFGSYIVFTIIMFATTLTNVILDHYSDSIQNMGVSLVWGLLSIGFVFYGILRENKRVRIFGIVWIFVTLMKLIFFDLPSVSILIRAILFIGLGTIGVFMSRFFYNKHDEEK